MGGAGTAPCKVDDQCEVDELARLNRALRMLSSSNQALIHVTNEAGLVHDVCRIVVEIGGYVMATIVLATPESLGTPRIVAHAGPTDGSISLAFAIRAMEHGQLWVVRDIASDLGSAASGEDALRLGWQAAITLPLIGATETLGALCIHAASDGFDDREIEILSELAADLAFGIDTLRARAAHQRAEDELHKAQQEQRAHLHFFRSMDRINRVMQQATDLDRMMRDTLDAVLDIFECDRALLAWPCDPAAPSWQVPMESNRPEYPGALARKMVVPMTEGVADNMRFMLTTDGPVRFGGKGEHPLPAEVVTQFSIRTVVSQVIRPKVGAPWLFVVHQCSYERDWSDDELRLLQEIGWRLADGLTSLLMLQDLRIAATAFEAQEGIMITDADKVILRVNRAYTEITGYTAAEAVGQPAGMLRSGLHDAAFYAAMWDSVNTHGSWQGEVWNRRKSGEIFPEWLTITAVKNARGQTTHYIGMLTDISARKSAEAEIERLAFYDPLTHLPNRRLLIDRLQRALLGSERSGLLGALLFIDLDNFKILNDTQGHDIGDQLLIEVAHRLAECVRGGDTVARLGGDEFVVVLEDLSDSREEAAARAQGIGEKILGALTQPYLVADRAHHSTPSIGATLFLSYEVAVDELLKQADIAMYQAKASGRNTLRFFDPDMQQALASRAALETVMRHGVEERNFVLHYQAQVGRNGVIGAEALLRWQHPEHGLLLPGQFISLAEETGLILPIGQWVLRTACVQLRAWMDDPQTRDLTLAINVSARQFRQADFVTQVRQALHESGAPAVRLKLELTESLVLDDVADSIDKMQALKQLGVGLALDDFGTGYSSLSYLTRLPLSQLKIDQSFVRNLPDSANDAMVVQTIITLGRSLGMAVIAEGVETEAQQRFLETHGCLNWQGYLFGKPIEAAQFRRAIGER